MRRLSIVLRVVFPIFVVLALIMALYSRNELRYSTGETLGRLTREAFGKADEFSNILGFLRSDAESIATFIGDDLAQEGAESYIRSIIEKRSAIRSVTVCYDTNYLASLRKSDSPGLFFQGKTISPADVPSECSYVIYVDDRGKWVREEPNFVCQERDWYRVAHERGRGGWCEPIKSAYTGRAIMVYSVPFFRQGQLSGVIGVECDSDAVFRGRLGFNLSERDLGAFTYVLAGNGRILSHSGPKTFKCDLIYSLVPASRQEEIYPLIDRAVGGERGSVKIKDWVTEITGPGGKPQDTWFLSMPVESQSGIVLLSFFSESKLQREVWKRLLLVWSGALAFLFLAAFITGSTVDRLYRPVLTLARSVERLGEGHLDEQVPEELCQGRSEIAALATGFNKMIERLNGYVQKTIDQENLRLTLENDVRVAQHIQRSLLPVKESIHGWDYFSLDAALLPAYFVAGDFFDYWQVDDETIAILFGDVSGKGIPASLIMVETRTLIRQISVSHPSIEDILSEANRLLLSRNELTMFVTLFFAHYHYKTGVLEYCNAGHFPPATVLPDGTVQWFDKAKGSVLGVFSNVQFPVESKTLQPGEKFFLYTDGVTDARPENGEPFGEERLEELLSRLADKTVNVVIEAGIEELENYGEGNQADDMTLFVLERSDRADNS